MYVYVYISMHVYICCIQGRTTRMMYKDIVSFFSCLFYYSKCT